MPSVQTDFRIDGHLHYGTNNPLVPNASKDLIYNTVYKVFDASNGHILLSDHRDGHLHHGTMY